MRHLHESSPWVAFMLAGAVAACAGDEKAGQSAAGTDDTAAPAADIENAGMISGTVTFAGQAPPPEPIDMSSEPACAEKHGSQPMKRPVIVTDGQLANVFIYIKEGLSGTYAASGDAPEVDQEGCVYVPHVIGVQTGQQVTFRNSDGLLHNIKAQPKNNRTFNISQPTNMTSTQTFSRPEIMVPVQCDVHGWMNMYIGVTEHPYFAVSGEDGSFRLENVPPGTYTIEAWHERFGVTTQQVTVEPNGAANVTFEFNSSMAGAHVPLGQPIDPHGVHGRAVGD